ncbi:MAG: LLM class F420-dependent oxidoreductase, partial [Acidobacteria bacterium]|nr:LLM class F420-dependent oxidoreductase [Acidobacteriota bacterium]
ELARMQVAFYGSTPNYAFIFEQVGRPGTTAALREHQKAGDVAGMVAVIDDELLAHFVVEAPWEGLAEGILDRYEGLAERVVLYFAGLAARSDPATLERFGRVAAAVSAG